MAIKTAQSLQKPEVVACLQSLASGDEAHLPAGDVDWTDPTPANLKLPDNVRVIGAGYDKSIIRDCSKGGNQLLTFDCGQNLVEISDFSIKGKGVAGWDSGDTKWSGLIGVYGQRARFYNFEIDLTSYIVPTNSLGVAITNRTLLDHFIMRLTGSANGYRVYGTNDLAWSEPTGFGGEDFAFVEDFFITGWSGGCANDAMFGGKYTMRNGICEHVGIQTHPTASDRNRGCRAFDVYGVDFQWPAGSHHSFNAFWISSGCGVFHHNKIRGKQNMLTLHSPRRLSRAQGGTYDEQSPPNGWGYAGQSIDGSTIIRPVSNFDGNQDKMTGWPIMDQPGAGQGDLLGGDPPNVRNITRNVDSTSPDVYPRQIIEGVYEWANDYELVPNEGGQKISVYHPDALQSGRDYFVDTPKPGYTSYVYPHPRNRGGMVVSTSPLPPAPPTDPPIVVPPIVVPPVVTPPTPPPNGAPTVKFVKPAGTGLMYDLITEGKVITVKSQYLKIEANDDVGPVTLQIFIDNTLLAQNSNGEKTLTVKWNTNPYKGRDPLITGKVKDAGGQTAEVAVPVKVRH